MRRTFGEREPDFRSDCVSGKLVGRLSRAASTRRHHRAEQMGCASSKDAMSDSMGKAVCEAASGGNEAVYEAASDGNEAELRRMIGLGGSVNWHHPGVRRRMCLAWAPASSLPLLLRSPSPPTRRPSDTGAISPLLAARHAAALAEPPTRRPAELIAHASSSHGAARARARRAAPPRAHPRSSRYCTPESSMSVCLMCPGRRIHSSHNGHILGA